MADRLILDHQLFNLTLERLCHELIENYDDFSNAVIIGVQPRGVFLAESLANLIKQKTSLDLKIGKLDPTFHRDDFRSPNFPLEGNENEIDFAIEGKKVLLIDDVLYTGRTIRASLDALMTYGRPIHVELLVMIDRRFTRELPIQPNYTGHQIDTILDDQVVVDWNFKTNKHRVWIQE